MSAALASLRMGIKLVLAYRLEAAVQVVSASVVALLNWSLWTAIFQGRETVAGRTVAEMTTYVIVAWTITTFYATRVDQLLAERFRSGDVAVDLLRPWDLQLHLYLRDLGRALAALVLTTFPIALWTGLLLPLRLPQRAETWLALPVALLVAHGLSFSLSWLVGLVAFRLRNIVGLTHLKALGVSVLSGALIPLDVYPDAVRRVVLFLPFQGMSHVPADIFIERASPWPALILPVAWLLAMTLAGRVAFKLATRELVVQGG